MRLIDSYAIFSGSKIDKPYVFENFFPLTFDRYITFNAQTKFESKNYSYYQSVINTLFPILDKLGIKIVQVGGANEMLYQYVVDLRGKTDFGQLAYVMKGSSLHIGGDSLCVHLAAHYDVPLIGLYSVSQSAVSGPQFGTKEKQVCIDAYLRTKEKKPSYSDNEQPKCINLIMPEEISDAAFKLLKIDSKTPFKTVFIGSMFSAKMVREFIPIKAFPVNSPEIPIEIRMDIHFDENVLAQQLSMCRGLVITNKRINKDLLKQFKGNINALVYIVEENDEPAFIDDIRELGLTIVLLSYLSSDEIQKKKINYYKHGKINSPPPENITFDIKNNIESLYFRTNKLVSSDGKTYNGNVCRIADKELTSDFEYYKAKDCLEFWRELPFSIIVQKI